MNNVGNLDKPEKERYDGQNGSARNRSRLVDIPGTVRGKPAHAAAEAVRHSGRVCRGARGARPGRCPDDRIELGTRGKGSPGRFDAADCQSSWSSDSASLAHGIISTKHHAAPGFRLACYKHTVENDAIRRLLQGRAEIELSPVRGFGKCCNHFRDFGGRFC